MHFIDRADAGRQLAERVRLAYAYSDPVVYALPRGGVAIGIEIAHILGAPIDLIIPRKIGHPTDPEYAIGAVAEDGHLIANASEIATVDKDWLQTEVKAQQAEAIRRRTTYLAGRPPIDIAGKTALIVDDGIATGLTMRCAIAELKHRNPKKIILAVPVAPKDTLEELSTMVDDIICLITPTHMGSISSFYDTFPQVEDVEVVELLRTTDYS